ncbi:thiol-activated cytolysin family protein [Pedobacter lithocola]|uniref:Thiol-activated cytolysin family protein n=1 Tax=Pedobacter lithocola TaxID=1908239 RepID=A0ABV8PFM8_9SPHI
MKTFKFFYLVYLLLTSLLVLGNHSLNAQIKIGSVKQVPIQTGKKPGLPKTVQTGPKIQNASRVFSKTAINSGFLARFTNPSKTITLSDGTKLTTRMLINSSNALQLKQSPGVIKGSERNKKQENSNEWICESAQLRVSLEDNSFMNATNEQQSQNIYPGAIYTFDNFFSGSFKNETAARNPIRITSSAPGISGNIYEDVENPTPSEIKNAVNKLYSRMPSGNAISGYTHMLYECNSAADMALKIGAGASGYGVSASFDFNNKEKSERRYFMIDATQEMYSLNAEAPSDGLFKNVADASKTNLMMMGTVTYGQRVLVSIETKIKSQEQGIKLDASYSGYGAKANINISTFLKETSDETTVKMYVVGGSNQGFITLDKNSLMSKLNSYFVGTNFKNAKPIRYQFRNMNNEVIVSQSATDFFPTKQCVPNDANRDYKVTVNLLSIRNSTNPMEEVKFGLSQWTDARVNGNTVVPVTGESTEIVCWWDGVGEEGRVFKGQAKLNRTRTFTIKQGDIMNGAFLDIWTKYIAMYKTKIGGKTNSRLDNKGFQHDKVFLKDVLLSNGGKGSSISKDVDVNFNSRVFTMNYVIKIQ